MPTVQTGDIETAHELVGAGPPLVLIHGGWVNKEMWAPQVAHFAPRYQVLTYDLRGHGETGPSSRRRYSAALWAEDLKALLTALQIERPIVCGLSLGGMVAQAFATQYPHDLSALILADTAISVSLTLSDKLQRYVIAPKWMFLGFVRLLGMQRYTDLAFWTARVTRGEKWFGLSEEVRAYVRREMERFDVDEFNKIFAAIYDFHLQPLERIRVPTLILNGEFESGAVFAHTRHALRMIPTARAEVIPQAGHTSNLENPAAFNAALDRFLAEAAAG